jgi:hypothetical protein
MEDGREPWTNQARMQACSGYPIERLVYLPVREANLYPLHTMSPAASCGDKTQRSYNVLIDIGAKAMECGTYRCRRVTD